MERVITQVKVVSSCHKNTMATDNLFKGFLGFYFINSTRAEPRNVKNAPQWNKCILTSRFPTSAAVASIYPRVFPTSVINFPISVIDFPTSQIEYADFQ